MRYREDNVPCWIFLANDLSEYFNLDKEEVENYLSDRYKGEDLSEY